MFKCVLLELSDIQEETLSWVHFQARLEVEGKDRELGEPGMVVCTCNPSFGEVEAGRLAVQGHVHLHSRF